MNKLYFFDLRPRPKYQEITGKELELEYLLGHVVEPEMVRNPNLYLSSDEAEKTEIFNSKSQNWDKSIRTVLLLISGKTITNQTLNIYKKIYHNVERVCAKEVNLDLYFLAFFVTIMLGFQAHIYGWSEKNSNRISDYFNFISKAVEKRGEVLSITSIFCAHRESDLTDKNTLVKEIKEVCVRRYVYLLYSLFLNLRSKKIYITLYHSSGSKDALSVVFPNITLKYIRENRVSELLEQIDQHFSKVESIINSLKIPSVSMKLVPLAEFIEKVELECVKVCGTKWREIENFSLVSNEDIRTITREMTINDVRRYMPEYENKEKVKIDINKTISKREAEAVNLYFGRDRLNLYSKALYETLFYYTWGKITKSLNGVAVGVDRDHDLFQVQAFHLGYSGIVDMSHSAPILYARRTEAELINNDINSTSIRQFWRLSENDKK